MIFIVFFQVFVLTIWFESSIVKTLSSLKIFNSLFRYDEYERFRSTTDIFAKYHDFLSIKYKNWFAKLVTCIICLNFWLTMLTTWGTLCVSKNLSTLKYFFPNYIGSLLIYLIIRKLL